MNSGSHYDVAIIGAGLSGLAAGIRLAHFGQRVCIFERHNAVGGLNGFYSLGGRKFDVGLHAVTNYIPPGVKGSPLGKLLRQLRIDRAELGLRPQRRSRVAFGPHGETDLKFTNDFRILEAEVEAKFPRRADAFRRVSRFARDHSLKPEALPGSTRDFLRTEIGDPLLEDMLLCPLMFYGSARPRDIDLGQFAVMFRAIYLEGFARPRDGVRVILRVLLDRYRRAGGERRMKCGVREIRPSNGKVAALVLDTGEEITATHVLSSIGAPETAALIAGAGLPAATDPGSAARADRALGFVETISVLNRLPATLGWGADAIVFFNDSERFTYENPAEQVDPRSGIICFPDNFDYGPEEAPAEGMLRCTCLANYEGWIGLPEETYRADKHRWFDRIVGSACRFLPPLPDPGALTAATVATDMFTPRTVEQYTGHARGAIYGSPIKAPDGRTALSNLYLCGTDQGLLGIVGAMLGGITMANVHILARKAAPLSPS